jgi:hypothetical protein
MNYRIYCILVSLCFWGLARGEELIPGICWFDSPPNWERINEGNDPGDNPFSMRSKVIVFQSGTGADFNFISFSMRLVGATLGEGKVVTIKPISDEELKQAMAIELIHKRGTNAPTVEETTLAGQRTLKFHTPHDDHYWVRVRPNRVLEIHLHAPSEPHLVEVQGWLSSLNIQVSDKPDPRPLAKLVNDEIRIGMDQSEVFRFCGKPLMVGGYLTEKYFIYVEASPTVNFINYTKVSDAQKIPADVTIPELQRKFLPFPIAEAKEILKRNTGGNTGDGKFSWSSAGKNRWKRSDGVMAGLDSKGFTIATAEVWPHLHFNE